MRNLLFALFTFIIISIAASFFKADETRTPYTLFHERIGRAALCEYVDPEFGYTLSYPCFFQQENVDDDNNRRGCARFAYRDNTNIIIDTCVIMPCEAAHIMAKNAKQKRKRTGGTAANLKSFIRSEPVAINGITIPGYSRYSKYIVSGKTLFMISLTYPNDYRPSMSRLLKIVNDWKVIGVC